MQKNLEKVRQVGAASSFTGQWAAEAVLTAYGVGTATAAGVATTASDVSPWIYVASSTAGGAVGGGTGALTTELLSGERDSGTIWRKTYQGMIVGGTMGFLTSNVYGTDYEGIPESVKKQGMGKYFKKDTYDCLSFAKDYKLKGAPDKIPFSWEKKHFAVSLGKSRGVKYFLSKVGQNHPILVSPGHILNNFYGAHSQTTWQNILDQFYAPSQFRY